MMVKLKLWIIRVLRFLSQLLPKKDKADHFMVMLVFARICQIWVGDWTVLILCSIPILGKELIIDKLMGLGEFEWKDIGWGYLAVFIIIIINQLIYLL